MVGSAYEVTLYNTSAEWITACEATTADKLVFASTWKEEGKLVWFTVVAT